MFWSPQPRSPWPCLGVDRVRQPTSTSSTRATPTTATATQTKPPTLVSQRYAEDRNASEPMTITDIGAKPGQMIVLFVATDGPPDMPQTVAGVSGGDLTWTRAVQGRVRCRCGLGRCHATNHRARSDDGSR